MKNKYYDKLLPVYIITVLSSVIEGLIPKESFNIKRVFKVILKASNDYTKILYKHLNLMQLTKDDITDGITREEKVYAAKYTFSKAAEMSAIMLNRTIEAINEGDIEEFFKYVEQYDTHKLVKKNLNG